jgi:hypothetical protein
MPGAMAATNAGALGTAASLSSGRHGGTVMRSSCVPSSSFSSGARCRAVMVRRPVASSALRTSFLRSGSSGASVGFVGNEFFAVRILSVMAVDFKVFGFSS